MTRIIAWTVLVSLLLSSSATLVKIVNGFLIKRRFIRIQNINIKITCGLLVINRKLNGKIKLFSKYSPQ